MNETEKFETDFTKLVKALVKRLPLILLAALLAGGVGLFALRAPKTIVYKAKVSFLVQNNYAMEEENSEPAEDSGSLKTPSIETYAYVASSPTVLDTVVARSGIPFSSSELKKMVSVSTESKNINVFSVLIQTQSKEDTALVAQAISDHLPEVLAEITSCTPPRVLDFGSVSSAHSGGLSVKGGVLAALAAAFLTACFCAKKYADDEAKGDVELCVDELGTLNAEAVPVSVFRSSDDEETLKKLRSALRLSLSEKSGCRVVGLTGAKPDPEKEALACRLSRSFAQLGERVLLIEADLRDEKSEPGEKLKSEKGLCDILRGSIPAHEALRRIEEESLAFSYLAAGMVEDDSAELLDERKLLSVIRPLEAEFDYILIDLENIGANIDAALLCRELDGVLVFFRDGNCSRRQMNECLTQLSYAKARLLGFAVLLPQKPKREKA